MGIISSILFPEYFNLSLKELSTMLLRVIKQLALFEKNVKIISRSFDSFIDTALSLLYKRISEMEQSIISSNIPAKFLFALEKLSLNIRYMEPLSTEYSNAGLSPLSGTSEANSMISLFFS